MASSIAQPKPQQGSAPAPTQQQGQSAPATPQQQGQPIFRDWAAI